MPNGSPVIAVASGKGGTGKTTLAVSLALSWNAGAGQTSAPAPLFLDCDVEAPNAHLFLKPQFSQRREVGLLIPQVDPARCTLCGRCAEVCQFQAIAVLGQKALMMPKMCHGCGSCAALCPEGALSEQLQTMGVLEAGPAIAGIQFGRGKLNAGEPMAVPVIRELLGWQRPAPGQAVIIDAPPGASCPVVAAVRQADFLLLVTEATPFGLHDLQAAHTLACELGPPCAVVVNRCAAGPAGAFIAEVEAYCQAQNLPNWMRIPFTRAIAAGLAQAKPLVAIEPAMRAEFGRLALRLQQRMGAQ